MQAPRIPTVQGSGTVRLEFTLTAAESDGALHQMRATYGPGSPQPPGHLHPAQGECSEVHEGALGFVIEGVLRTVPAGEALDVPAAGAVHQVRNPGDVPAVVTWSTRPALRTGEFLCALHEARESGDVGRLLQVVEEHADVFVLAPQP